MPKAKEKKMNRIKWTQHIVRQRTYRFRYFKCMRFRPKGTILFVYISFSQKICWWHFAIESNEIEESMFKCHWVSGSSNKGNSLFDWMHCKGPTILETLDGLHFILFLLFTQRFEFPFFHWCETFKYEHRKSFACHQTIEMQLIHNCLTDYLA